MPFIPYQVLEAAALNAALDAKQNKPATLTTLPAAATDAATTQTLVNAIRTLLISLGLAQ
ncbi:hypothetical protein EON83_21400 [bacterium]|nr:MAG: hypothetical protein EON83_21400 [bacterium]